MRLTAIFVAILMLTACGAVQAGTQVDFAVTGIGSFTVELLDSTPLTTANFLQYVNAGRYDGTIFHRSDIGNQVLQLGGFALASDPGYLLQYVPTFTAVAYEGDLGGSNILGTIGMARTSDPNSATSQWYINMGDNSPWFDHQDGSPGYTVFGNVISGMDTLMAVYGLNVWDASGFFGLSAFSTLPLMDSFDIDIPLTQADFVSVFVPEPATLALVALGGLAAARRLRRR